jgi:hypothetical protein
VAPIPRVLRVNYCPRSSSKWASWRNSTTCTPRFVRERNALICSARGPPRTARHLGRSQYRRLGIGSCLRQGLAHGQKVLRTIDLVPVVRRAIRFRLRCRAGREPVHGAASAAQAAQERCIRLRPGMCRSAGQLFWYDCDGKMGTICTWLAPAGPIPFTPNFSRPILMKTQSSCTWTGT